MRRILFLRLGPRVTAEFSPDHEEMTPAGFQLG